MSSAFHWRRFLWALLAFAAVLLVGTVAFQVLLGEGWVDSFYRAVVSTTLTGLDTAPDSDAGKIFTVVLLFAGVAVFFYIAGVVVDVITRGVLGDVFGERRRRKEIEELRDHVIICGYGRVGRSVAAEFRATSTPYAVVDVTPESVALAQREGAAVVLGDGTEDDDLERAGIHRARGLVASVDSDEKNLYITLSARAQRPDLFIVARASNEAAASKIRLAGANRVVQPYSHAGLQLAKLVVRPQVADFLGIATTTGGSMPELRFEEIEVTPECGLAGKTIGDLRVQDVTGAVIVAIRRLDGSFEVTPGSDERLQEGEVVIGVGTSEEMSRLEGLFAPRQARVEKAELG